MTSLHLPTLRPIKRKLFAKKPIILLVQKRSDKDREHCSTVIGEKRHSADRKAAGGMLIES